MIFGPCPHTKIYNFDDTIFISYAIIIVFLPSNYTGGNYRFINQNLEPIYPSVLINMNQIIRKHLLLLYQLIVNMKLNQLKQDLKFY